MTDPNRPVSAGAVDSPSPSSQRIAWIESARGLGIALVVAGHVLHGLVFNGLLADAPILRFWDGQYYNPQMALFFALSGMFAERWTSRSGRSFLADKGATLLYPYFVWAGLQGLVRIAVAVHAGRPAPVEYLVWLPVYPVMQFWFIYALFFVSLLHYALRRVGVGPAGCVVVALLLYGIRPWGDENMQVSTMPLLRIFYFAPFYAIGAALGPRLASIREDGPAWPAVAVAVAGLAVVTASARADVAPPIPLQMAVTLCGIAALIATATVLRRAPALGFIRTLGRCSLEIYAIHMFAVEGVRPALTSVLHVRDPAVHLVVGVAVSLGGSMAFVRFCERYGVRYAFRLPKAGKAAAPRPSPRREPSAVMA